MNDDTRWRPPTDGPPPPSSRPAAASRPPTLTAVESADLDDQYARMLHLAEELAATGETLRAWASEGEQVLTEPDVVTSAPLSPRTWGRVTDELAAATGGPSGLLARAGDLDADAVALRATVATYRWLDDLQAAAYATLGSIAARAIGYLAPEVALGGAVVAAGLIETDTLDRDDVAGYLGELATTHPELMEHVTTGGGLAESLQMRSLLTAGLPAGEALDAARRGGLRAAGIEALPGSFDGALRDAAVALDRGPGDGHPGDLLATGAPRGLGDLLDRLTSLTAPVVQPVGTDRAIVYLPRPEPRAGDRGHLTLVSGDVSGYADDVMAFLSATEDLGPRTRLLLAGIGTGGAAAVELAGRADSGLLVEEVLTANAPSAAVPRLPAGLPVLSLEDRRDPVALLGSLINAGTADRLTVVYDPSEAPAAGGEEAAVAGGRIADLSAHPDLRAHLARWRERGYLSPA